MQSIVQSPPRVEADEQTSVEIAVEVETEAASAAPEQVNQVANTVQEGTVVYPVDESNLHTFRSSPKSRSRFGSFSGPLPIRVKIGAVAGWSVVAAVGAAALVMSPGPLMGVRLAELGAVWGAISALVWFLPGKLIK